MRYRGFRFVSLLVALGAAIPEAAGQPFAVMVHRSNPVYSLSWNDLRAIFSGGATRWPNQEKAVLAHREPGSPSNRFLMDRLLKTSWQDYKRSLQSLEFMGQEPAVFRVLNSDALACKFVFNVPGAVAVIEAASAAAPECRELRILKIDGYSPGQEGYRLK